jgi:hypothetical protein
MYKHILIIRINIDINMNMNKNVHTYMYIYIHIFGHHFPKQTATRSGLASPGHGSRSVSPRRSPAFGTSDPIIPALKAENPGPKS